MTTLASHFWSKVNKTDGCWFWTASRYSNGYGQTAERGEKYLAHRVAYELVVGPIPEGLELDHLCRVRHCVNPVHLEPVTHAENMRRGDTIIAAQVRQTHCKHGHEFDELNTGRDHKGGRRCRACDRDRARKVRAR